MACSSLFENKRHCFVAWLAGWMWSARLRVSAWTERWKVGAGSPELHWVAVLSLGTLCSLQAWALGFYSYCFMTSNERPSKRLLSKMASKASERLSVAFFLCVSMPLARKECTIIRRGDRNTPNSTYYTTRSDVGHYKRSRAMHYMQEVMLEGELWTLNTETMLLNID